jgi:alpha-D-ribose 1-methylphosphonate 5-triphosphate synthase subunit PhnG
MQTDPLLSRHLRDCFPSNLGFSPVAQNEKTSARVAQIASKALQNPSSLSQDEIKTLAASALTQSPDQQQRQQAQQFLQNQENQQSQQKK